MLQKTTHRKLTSGGRFNFVHLSLELYFSLFGMLLVCFPINRQQKNRNKTNGAEVRGKIFKINHRRGMVAILTERGDFSTFEIIGADPVEEGDDVFWENDTGLGEEILHNLTQNQKYEIYFQNHWVSQNQLTQQLFL